MLICKSEKAKGFTDIHSHFLYDLDDGAENRKHIEEMLNAAYADGFRCLFATPYTVPGIVPFDMFGFMDRLEAAKHYCRRRGYYRELRS